MKKLFFALSVVMLTKSIATSQTSQFDFGLSVSSISHEKLLLSWNRPSEMRFKCYIMDCNNVVIDSTFNVTSKLIKNLNQNTSYSYKVKIVTPTGDPIISECVTGKTQTKIGF